MLNIITITKNDLNGIKNTVNSTKYLRENFNVSQLIIDGSDENISSKIKLLVRNEKNVKYFWQLPSGISNAFNFGISMSEDGWLWFLNGGDVVDSNLDLNLIYFY